MLQDEDLLVRVFPRREETLISRVGFGTVALNCIGAAEPEVRQSAERAIHHRGAMINKFLEFPGSFFPLVQQSLTRCAFTVTNRLTASN